MLRWMWLRFVPLWLLTWLRHRLIPAISHLVRRSLLSFAASLLLRLVRLDQNSLIMFGVLEEILCSDTVARMKSAHAVDRSVEIETV